MRQFIDALRRHVGAAPGAPAFADDAEAVTRAEFLARIGALAAALPKAQRVVGLIAPNGVDWAAAQFAAALTGKTLVPLPTFFAPAQLGHIVRDASIELIWAAAPHAAQAAATGAAILPLETRGEGGAIEPADGFEQIIYTSGTSGTPKGVRHGAGQIAFSARALAAATSASEQDRYLSVLPLAALLETICAIFIPALVGGSVRFASALAEGIGRGQVGGLAETFAAHDPTASVLVPELLRVWVGELMRAGRRAPPNLRFIAVGGAAVPPAVVDAAWRLGIPVHEGYGLSECCSVVALNRVGERRAGTVGRPLDGLVVRVVDGEIVVDGPTVTNGYLGRPDHRGPWPTGDLGAFDADGFLTVHGRKDNVLVTPLGRNVSPEWIETMLLADPRIGQAALIADETGELVAVLMPSPIGGALATADSAALDALVRGLCAEAPTYAIPRRTVVIAAAAAVTAGLLTANGRVRRKPLADHVRALAPAA